MSKLSSTIIFNRPTVLSPLWTKNGYFSIQKERIDINLNLLDLAFIYLSMGLLHHIMVVIIKHHVVKTTNPESQGLNPNALKQLFTHTLGWPVLIIYRMFKYESMAQTLTYIEEKLETYMEENND